MPKNGQEKGSNQEAFDYFIMCVLKKGPATANISIELKMDPPINPNLTELEEVNLL